MPRFVPPTPQQALEERDDFRRIDLYDTTQRILVCGDGNLSFSAAVCRFLRAPNLVATTFDSRAHLDQIYPPEDIARHIHDIEASGSSVLHGIDATVIDCYGLGRFDRVVWNQPHAGTPDGVQAESEATHAATRRLIATFLEAVAGVVAPGGQLHIRYKTGHAWLGPDEFIRDTQHLPFTLVSSELYTKHYRLIYAGYKPSYGDTRTAGITAPRPSGGPQGYRGAGGGERMSYRNIRTFVFQHDPSKQLLPKSTDWAAPGKPIYGAYAKRDLAGLPDADGSSNTSP
jgi:hypothetical protein